MKKILFCILLIVIMSISFPSIAADTKPGEITTVSWVEGPTTVTMEPALLDLDENLRFLNKSDTVKMLEFLNKPKSGNEIGSVYSKGNDRNWFILFEYFDVGHVSDEDRDKIFPNQLLNKIINGSEGQNKERVKKDEPEVYEITWVKKPYYYEGSNILVWCLAYYHGGEKIVYYESDMLCREGYVTTKIMCSPEDFVEAEIYAKKIIGNISVDNGKKYSDYIPNSDKLSNITLKGLIASDAIASAESDLLFVLLKNFWFIVLLPILVALARFIKIKKKSPKQKASSNINSTFYNINSD